MYANTVDVQLTSDCFTDFGRTEGASCVQKGDIMNETNIKVWACAIALTSAAIAPAATPTLTVIQEFNGTNGATGYDPTHLIQASDGNFYGIPS
jgi:hypothetical protein